MSISNHYRDILTKRIDVVSKLRFSHWRISSSPLVAHVNPLGNVQHAQACSRLPPEAPGSFTYETRVNEPLLCRIDLSSNKCSFGCYTITFLIQVYFSAWSAISPVVELLFYSWNLELFAMILTFEIVRAHGHIHWTDCSTRTTKLHCRLPCNGPVLRICTGHLDSQSHVFASNIYTVVDSRSSKNDAVYTAGE